MAKGRDRPKKQAKRKAKEKAPKNPAGATGPVVQSYQPPMRQVEVIKPKRKERDSEPQDEE
ncbi:MAG: hypothetical protein ACRDGD_10740 [Candidatus Limnocylindria bacterium]